MKGFKKMLERALDAVLSCTECPPQARPGGARPYWCAMGHYVSEPRCHDHPNEKPKRAEDRS